MSGHVGVETVVCSTESPTQILVFKKNYYIIRNRT